MAPPENQERGSHGSDPRTGFHAALPEGHYTLQIRGSTPPSNFSPKQSLLLRQIKNTAAHFGALFFV
jgi:hypothetical protein